MFISSLTLFLFVVGVMVAMNQYVAVGQCNTGDEALHMIRSLKLILSVPYM